MPAFAGMTAEFVGLLRKQLSFVADVRDALDLDAVAEAELHAHQRCGRRIGRKEPPEHPPHVIGFEQVRERDVEPHDVARGRRRSIPAGAAYCSARSATWSAIGPSVRSPVAGSIGTMPDTKT